MTSCRTMVTAVTLAHLLFICDWKLFNTSSYNIFLTLQKELKELQVTQYASFIGWRRLRIDCFQLWVTSSSLLFTETNQHRERKISAIHELSSHSGRGTSAGQITKGWMSGGEAAAALSVNKTLLRDSYSWLGKENQPWKQTFSHFWI